MLHQFLSGLISFDTVVITNENRNLEFRTLDTGDKWRISHNYTALNNLSDLSFQRWNISSSVWENVLSFYQTKQIVLHNNLYVPTMNTEITTTGLT